MKENFKKLVNDEQPVLVVFFAEWCGHCKKMSPVLQEIAPEVSGKARIVKIDIDKNPDLTLQFQVQGVPTFILFKNGESQWTQAGAISKEKLLEVLNGSAGAS